MDGRSYDSIVLLRSCIIKAISLFQEKMKNFENSFEFHVKRFAGSKVIINQ